ncbi:MAG: hypothetical protein ACHQ1H_02905 [Nitrososphaerales archaeon]
MKARKEGNVILASPGKPPLLSPENKENFISSIASRTTNTPIKRELPGIASAFTPNRQVPSARTVRRVVESTGKKLKFKRGRLIEIAHLHAVGKAPIQQHFNVPSLSY